jgi:hypothetical protein
MEGHVLADNVNAFGAANPKLKMPISIWSEYDAKRHCLIYTAVAVGDPFPPYWGVMLGNVVHNYRCCLDHIAWVIYKRGRTPCVGEEREKKIYFPVTSSPRHFKNVVPTMLPGARRADLAKVRAFQPYRAGKRNRERHVLWVLHRLDLDDKHRTIQPVVPVPDSSGFGIGAATDCIYRRMAPASPRVTLEPGAELTRIYVKKTGPNPHIDVEPHFTIDPSVWPRLTLEEFLNTTRQGLLRLLYAFSEPPDSTVQILGGKPDRPD